MPDFTIVADNTRTKQIIVNLLSNAAKYAKENAVVEIGCEEASQNRVRCFVKDNGPGIPLSRHHDLFQEFNRLDAVNSTVEGTGLGLVISKKIAEQMNGRMGFESQPGIGSCFWFELVVLSPHGTGVGDSGVAPLELYKPNHERSRKVLYIEDNQASVRLVEQIFLRLSKFDLVTAATPGIGLDLAKKSELELILLDLNLPEVSGYELLKQLRSMPHLSHVPVIAISANSKVEDSERVREAGFDAFITKPFVISTFVDTLEKYVR